MLCVAFLLRSLLADQMCIDILCRSFVIFRLRNHIQIQHFFQNRHLPFLACLLIDIRRIQAGGFRDARNACRLCQRQLTGMLAVIILRRRLYATQTMMQRYRVQIQLQNIFLCRILRAKLFFQRIFQRNSQILLLYLSGNALFALKYLIFQHLLRQRTCTLRKLNMPCLHRIYDILLHCTHNPSNVNAIMLIKTLILNRDDRILHIACDCGKLHILSIFLAMQLIHLIIIRIIDDRGIGIGQNIGGIQHIRALQNTEHRAQNCACNRKGNHDDNNQQNLPDSAVDRAFLSALSAFFRVSGRGWTA